MYESEFVMLKYLNLTFCVHITSFIKSIKKTNFMTFWKFSRKIKKIEPTFHSFIFIHHLLLYDDINKVFWFSCSM